jgi:hypothetical protein
VTEPAKFDTSVWYVIAVECDRRGTEWVLWAIGDGPDLGKVEANGGPFFVGEYERAGELWHAFARQ